MEEAKRGPERRWVGCGCGFIEDDRAREVTFSKRHQGFFRKAAELSILCGAEIAVITYLPHGNPFAFAHPSTPDGLIGCYRSVGAPPPAAFEATVHRKLEEETDQEARRGQGRSRQSPEKMKRWWEEAVADSMNVEELEQYVALLEGLRELVTDSLGQRDDSDFYDRLLATDMDISLALDAAFLAELQCSLQWGVDRESSRSLSSHNLGIHRFLSKFPSSGLKFWETRQDGEVEILSNHFV